jgi:hypothetical protein
VKRHAIKTTIHIEPHDDEIQVLTTIDHGMWSNTAPPLLSSFNDQYCVKYAAIPSNTHKDKSTIKDANHSQIKCREEVMTSIYATA